jgi:hypothetical protein
VSAWPAIRRVEPGAALSGRSPNGYEAVIPLHRGQPLVEHLELRFL